MHLRLWLAALVTAVVLPVTAAAGSDLTPNALFDKPDKQIELDGLKQMGKSKKVLLPSVTLQLLVTGDMFASGNAGGNVAQAKMKYATLGLDKAYAQKLAADAYQDLVTKITAAGYQVITWDQIKDRPDVQKMDRLKPAKGSDMPQVESREKTGTYLVVTPSDDQAIDPPMQGLTWGFRKVAKELDATTLDVVYVLDAPQVWAESEKGYKRVEVSVNSAPGMTLKSAWIRLATAKGAWGSLTTRAYAATFADNVGTLSKASDDTPTAANALSSALGMLSGFGKIDRKSGIYVFQIDPVKYADATAKATGAINSLWAEATAPYAK